MVTVIKASSGQGKTTLALRAAYILQNEYIGYIAEELWIYSKSVELLTEPEDACYLAAQTQDIQLNITEMLCLLKNKLPVKDVDWLIEICDNVFSGEKFDDIKFNNVIEHFIQKKIEQ